MDSAGRFTAHHEVENTTNEHSAMRRPTGQLTVEERALLASLRKLRRAEAQPLKIPAALLEHGYVTPVRAAKMLGVKLADVKKHLDPKFWDRNERIVAAGFATGPLFPVSELLRHFIRGHRAMVKRLASETVNLVKAPGVNTWQSMHWGVFDEEESDGTGGFLSVEQIAEELGTSKAAAKRYMEDQTTGGLFCRRHRRYYGHVATREEVVAFKRKLERAASKTARAA